MIARHRAVRLSVGAVVLAAIIVLVVLLNITPRTTNGDTSVPVISPTPTSAAMLSVTPSPAATVATSALSALNKLTVSNAFVAHYVRANFGKGWKDPDRNGCDARNDVLARDLTAVTFKPGTHDCVVLTGTLADPYTGQTLAFVRGHITSMTVQIDHIVPLGWAWQHGAATWTADQRLVFANDPSNLLAVSGPANESKSDKGPGEWMPANTAYRCTYIQKFEASLVKYKFSIAQDDLATIRGYLATCGA